MRCVVYQLFVRHFSNFTEGGVPWGSRRENGCGTFNAITDAALEQLARMGVTHLWFTGVLRHASQSAYPGLPAEPACIVKGKAGSPYAVTDYFDVDPDLAEVPERRLEEYAALLRRCRRWGMIPVMDFVPNHVSRHYNSTVRPQSNFGSEDNRDVFFARDNAFYYLQPHSPGSKMLMPGGEYEPERGAGRVTGNNAAEWHLSPHDWYETVKLNYGSDYRHGPHAAGQLPGLLAPEYAVPRTWQRMNEVLAYWQELGVGGFRCDMAHMVPIPFWQWIIAHARLRDGAAFFMAEAYNDHMKLVEGDVHAALLAAGFNGVYDSSSYDALRRLYESHGWANDWDALHRPERQMFHGGVRYLENHDEPRVASPMHWGGVGSRVLQALMVAHYASSCGPVLVYNGQEVGERAEGPGGFGGDNGRTSIFDYTSLPRLQHWTHGGSYDGALLTEEEWRMRADVAQLLPLLQHAALAKGGFYGLNWANRETPAYGRMPGESVSGHYMYAFLRHYRKAKATVLAVCNLHPRESMRTHVHIPEHAREWAGKKPGVYRFIPLPEGSGECVEISAEKLDGEGFPVVLPPGRACLWEWC